MRRSAHCFQSPLKPHPDGATHEGGSILFATTLLLSLPPLLPQAAPWKGLSNNLAETTEIHTHILRRDSKKNENLPGFTWETGRKNVVERSLITTR